MRRGVVSGALAALILAWTGGALVTGLAVGDIQAAHYRKVKMCTGDQMVYTWVPVQLKRKIIAVPCPAWPKEGETF